MADAPLMQTPLHELHLRLGARMVPFAGYAMPVQYPAGLMATAEQTLRLKPQNLLLNLPLAPRQG